MGPSDRGPVQLRRSGPATPTPGTERTGDVEDRGRGRGREATYRTDEEDGNSRHLGEDGGGRTGEGGRRGTEEIVCMRERDVR